MYKHLVDYPEDKLPLEQIGKVTFMPNDVSNLLNQNRLSLLGLDTARDYIQRMQPQSSSRPQLDDDTLFRTIRSRHIQSLSELRSYIDSIDNSINEAVSEYKKKQSAPIVDPIVEPKPE